MEQLTKDYVKYMTGKDVDVIVTATGEGSGYIRGDQLGEGKNDVFVWDLKQLADGGSASEIIGHEVNHIDDHRRGRESHNETDSNSLGGRFKENLGEDGKSNGFDLGKWLSQGDNLNTLLNGADKLDTEYEGYDVEKNCYPAGDPNCYKNADPNYLNNAKAARERAKALKVIENTVNEMNKKGQEVLKEKEKTKYMGSPGLLNSSENQKKKKNLNNAVSNIKERKPNLSEEEITVALNKFGVVPDPNGDVTIAADGKILFKVKNDQAVATIFALISEDGLGIPSGGSHTIQQAGLAKGQGKSYIDITGGAIDLEIISGLTIEGLAAQKYNSKLQEMKNLNKPLYLKAPEEGGTLNIGAGKNPTPGAYNIDYKNSNPNIGVHKGDATNLSNVKTGSQSKVVIENPKNYDALNPEVIRVVEKGGRIELTGNYSNKDFKKYFDMSEQELGKFGFKVERKGNVPLEQAKQGYQTNGKPIPIETMKELILIKK